MKKLTIGDSFAYLTIQPSEENTGQDNSDYYLVEICTDQAMEIGGKEASRISFVVNGNMEMREMCRIFGNAGRRLGGLYKPEADA